VAEKRNQPHFDASKPERRDYMKNFRPAMTHSSLRPAIPYLGADKTRFADALTSLT
jgi:hypothetical protein